MRALGPGAASRGALLLLGALVAACGASGGGESPPPVAGACGLEVSPDRLTWRSTVGATTARDLVVEVTRRCRVEATFSGDPVWRLAPTAQTVDPGPTVPWTLRFTPDAARSVAGTLQLRAEDGATRTVDLVGWAEAEAPAPGDEPAFLVIPSEIDFGALSPGCESRGRLVESYALEIPPPDRWVARRLVGPDAAAFGNTADPLALVPDQVERIGLVTFRPPGVGRFEARLELDSAQGQRQVVPLVGEGAPTYQLEDFFQIATPRVDVVLVVDAGPEAFAETASLALGLQSSLQALTEDRGSFQLALLDARSPPEEVAPGLEGPTPTTYFNRSHDAAALRAAVQRVVGAEGRGPAAAMETVRRALLTVDGRRRNPAFLRGDATPVVVFAATEDDASLETADFYANFFISTRVPQATFMVGADAEAGCNAGGVERPPMPRYGALLERLAATPPVSACAPDPALRLGEAVRATLGQRRDTFYLRDTPLSGTLEVTIDDVPTPGGAPGPSSWWYDASQRALVFGEAAIPDYGAHVFVRYQVTCL